MDKKFSCHFLPPSALREYQAYNNNLAAEALHASHAHMLTSSKKIISPETKK